MPAATKKTKKNAPRNRTTRLLANDDKAYSDKIVRPSEITGESFSGNAVICGDAFEILPKLTEKAFDLLFADPPYNLTKKFGKENFRRTDSDAYEEWLDSWLKLCVPLLAPTASVYICGDWRSGAAIQRVGSKYFKLRNRITWEREKGRGAMRNWKNSAEDIWFFTVSNEFTFNLDAVKQRRRVLAPYRETGKPKDWQETETGNYRDTHPSNIWTDITVPFWSMPENTEHPTQKPEKMLAKIILASTDPNNLILDPFAGSGTAVVVAQKLGRRCVAIESDEKYCLIAQKRLCLAQADPSIQGFDGSVFWERNSGRPRSKIRLGRSK